MEEYRRRLEANAEGHKMVRYADDLVIMCRSEEEALKAMKRMKEWMQNAGLRLSDEKTRIVNMGQEGEWMEFLGYHFESNGLFSLVGAYENFVSPRKG